MGQDGQEFKLLHAMYGSLQDLLVQSDFGEVSHDFLESMEAEARNMLLHKNVDTLQPPLALKLCSHMWLATFPALKLVRHYMRLLIAASAYGKQYTVDQIKECIVAVYTKTNASGQLNSA